MRYRGQVDFDDVVLWRRDPLAVSPRGERSPVARAADLAPLLYSRATTPEEEARRDSAAAEAQALLAGWSADSAALDAAARETAGRPEPGPEPDPGHPADRSRARVPWGPVALAVGVSALAAVILLAVVLRPATVPELADPPPTAAPSESVTPMPTPTATLTPTAPPPPTAVEQTPPPEETDLRPDYFEQDIVSVMQVPLNGAPIDNANGVAEVDAYGVPLSYVVANGDVFELIAKRFDLGTTYLASINAVRRENPTELFVGDTLNLGAATILTIGDQNGVVYNFTDRLPEPHVPQY